MATRYVQNGRVILGTIVPQLTGVRVVSDPTKGTTTSVEYTTSVGGAAGGNQVALPNLDGTTRTAITAGQKVEGYADTKISRVTISQNGYGQDLLGNPVEIVPVVSWQLISTQSTKDIKEHPRVLAIDHDTLQRVLQLVKNFHDGIPLPVGLSLDSNDDPTQLFNLLVHGVTSYAINSHVARRTVSIPIDGASVLADLRIPSAFAAAVAAIPINGPNDLTRFKWGWRKTGYQFGVSANNRIEVTTEWALSGWSLLLYDGGAISYPQPA